MKVRKLTAHILRVPLKRPFRHASAERHYSDNVVVEATLADGTTGWGEGVPREYVTGESAEGALQQLHATPVAEQLAGTASNWAEAFAICDLFVPHGMEQDPRKCHGNALRAAVELSLLDAYGKLFGEPVSHGIEQFLADSSLLAPRPSVQYSTTIDAEHARRLWRSALKMRAYGFRQCKVKVGADQEADAARLAIVRRWIGPRVDLRVDANEAWHPETMIAHAAALAAFGVTCIEQPLPHADMSALAELRQQVGVPIMLDESLTSLHDAREAIRLSACDLLNIRISKCGGILNSLRIAMLAHEQGIGYQLGCHPGETGILSAAGRHFATAVGGIRYLEGSYDRHVLARQLTTPDLTFRYGGRAPRIDRPGLGVALDLAACKDLLRDEVRIEIQ